MSTRKLKILRIIAFVSSMVLSCAVLVCMAFVPVSAVTSVSSVGDISLPACFMSFNFRVYQTKDIYGTHFTTRSFNIPLMEKYGFDTVDYGGYTEYDLNTSVQVPYAETYDIGVTLIREWSGYEITANDYGYDYEAFNEFYVDVFQDVWRPGNRVDVSSVELYACDYYIWGSEFLDFGDSYGNTTPLNIRIDLPSDSYDSLSLLVNYSLQGDIDLRQYSASDDEVQHDDNYVYFNVTPDTLGVDDDTLVYIHSARLVISDNDELEALDNDRLLETQLEGNYLNVDVQGSYITSTNLRDIDVQSHTVDYEFQNYTAWLGNAIGGFMSTEIFGGITFGGILAMLLGFFGVVWFLKLFAGG